MRRHLARLLTALAWLYAGLLALWLALHLWLGDGVWWLALLSAFAPFLFAPLVVLLPLALLRRRVRLWLALLPPLAIFLALYGRLFLPAWPAPALASEPPLSVMTFNVWGFSKAPETARVMLEEGTPDLVLLQELSPELAAVLERDLAEQYPYRLLRPMPGAAGMGIMSRYPLTPLRSHHLRAEGSYVQVAEVQVGERRVTVYNCHPIATNVLAYLKEPHPLAPRVERTYTIRTRFIRRLLRHVATRQGPVLVGGDFNATERSDVYGLLTRSLEDAHAVAGWGFQHTFPAYAGSVRGLPSPPRQVRIDMIFYSRALVALESRAGRRHGESDHLPSLARLGWTRGLGVSPKE